MHCLTSSLLYIFHIILYSLFSQHCNSLAHIVILFMASSARHSVLSAESKYFLCVNLTKPDLYQWYSTKQPYE